MPLAGHRHAGEIIGKGLARKCVPCFPGEELGGVTVGLPRRRYDEVISVLRLECCLFVRVGEQVLAIEHHHDRAVGRSAIGLVTPDGRRLPESGDDRGRVEARRERSTAEVTVDRADPLFLGERAKKLVGQGYHVVCSLLGLGVEGDLLDHTVVRRLLELDSDPGLVREIGQETLKDRAVQRRLADDGEARPSEIARPAGRRAGSGADYGSGRADRRRRGPAAARGQDEGHGKQARQACSGPPGSDHRELPSISVRIWSNTSMTWSMSSRVMVKGGLIFTTLPRPAYLLVPKMTPRFIPAS